MDRRVKERLVGASILVVLIILIVPELLSGPAPVPVPPAAPMLSAAPASARERVRNVTVDLATSKAPAPEPPAPEPAAASSAAPQEVPSTAAVSAVAPPPAALETAPPAPTSAAAASKLPVTMGHPWSVQLGSFASRANADKLVRQLKAQGFAVYVLPGGTGASLRYRVRVGPMADRNSAALAVAKLNSLGHSGTVVPPNP
jgi:DedD protein